ncbi:MAG: RsmE family RNA methyltransferase [Fibrobacter sp.]|nr:RsmE family RNA methyltransferase [Fibrobacter sp.]
MRDFNHFLFFSEQINEPQLFLDSSETHHAVNVLRLQTGDKFKATDGKGCIYTCVADSISGNVLTGTILEKQIHDRSISSIRVITGITDKEHFEELIMNCTALGIHNITPADTEFSQKSWWQKSWEKQYGRFRSKMISATKQSFFPFVPILDTPATLAKINFGESSSVFVADPLGVPFQMIPDESLQQNISCIVGPPGGFSKDEIDFFKEKQFRFIKIGPNRLRTELAVVAFCSQIIARQLR